MMRVPAGIVGLLLVRRPRPDFPLQAADKRRRSIGRRPTTFSRVRGSDRERDVVGELQLHGRQRCKWGSAGGHSWSVFPPGDQAHHIHHHRPTAQQGAPLLAERGRAQAEIGEIFAPGQQAQEEGEQLGGGWLMDGLLRDRDGEEWRDQVGSWAKCPQATSKACWVGWGASGAGDGSIRRLLCGGYNGRLPTLPG
jgi:hypothetical protein